MGLGESNGSLGRADGIRARLGQNSGARIGGDRADELGRPRWLGTVRPVNTPSRGWCATGLAQEKVIRFLSVACLTSHHDHGGRIKVGNGNTEHLRGGISEVLRRGCELDALEPGGATGPRPGDIVYAEVAVIDAPISGRHASKASGPNGHIRYRVSAFVSDTEGDGCLARAGIGDIAVLEDKAGAFLLQVCAPLLVNSQPGIKPIPATNAIRKRIRVCFIDIFPYCFFDFYVVSSTRRSSLRTAQMCFCPLKRKWWLKPAKFFFAQRVAVKVPRLC